MIPFTKSFIFSSATASGARNKADNGASFQVYLEQPILIKKAVYAFIEVQSVRIWNTVPNVVEGQNKFYYSDLSGDLTITIPEGTYDVSSLNFVINEAIVNSGRGNDDCVIIGNTATNKISIRFKNIGSEVDFTPSDTIREILGYDSVVIGPTTVVDESIEAGNVAKFNNVDFFLLHSDLIKKGIRYSDKFQQIIAEVNITAPTSSLIIYEPQHTPQIVANELIGNKINLINFWLTDQNNNRVNTGGEDYSFRMVVRYYVREEDAKYEE